MAEERKASKRLVPQRGMVVVGESTTRLLVRKLTAEPRLSVRHGVLVALLVVAAAVYLPIVNAGFVMDDWGLVYYNKSIRTASGVVDSFGQGDVDSPHPATRVFRPFRTISYALNYKMSGLEPWGYHLTNIVLHLLTVLSVYAAAKQLTKSFFMAAVAAGVFALHPVHTETVDNIASRADLLAAPLLLFAFASYVKRREGKGPMAWLPAAALYMAALLCKETAVVFPVVLLVYDWGVPPKGRGSKEHLRTRMLPYGALAVVAALYMVVRHAAMKGSGGPAEPWSGSVGATAVMMFEAAARYARLLVFPLELSARHEIPEVESVLSPGFIGGALVMVALSLAALAAFRRAPLVFFGLGWIIIFLVPVSNIVPAPGTMLAEHWLYLPAFGMSVVFGSVLGGLMARVYRTSSTVLFSLVVAVVLIILGFFATRTVLRHDVWMNDGKLAMSILEENPDRIDARMKLADYYLEVARSSEAKSIPGGVTGLLEKAEVQWRHVLSLDEHDAYANFQVGNAEIENDNFEKAEQHLRESARSKQFGVRSQFSLGMAMEGLGRAEEAIRHYRLYLEGVESEPDRTETAVIAARARARIQVLEAGTGENAPEGGGTRAPGESSGESPVESTGEAGGVE